MSTVKNIKEKKSLLMMDYTRESDVRGNRGLITPNKKHITRDQLEENLERLGVDHEDSAAMVDGVSERARRKRSRSEDRSVSMARAETAKRPLATSRARSVSVVPGEGSRT